MKGQTSLPAATLSLIRPRCHMMLLAKKLSCHNEMLNGTCSESKDNGEHAVRWMVNT
jgi:hypothetical protein